MAAATRRTSLSPSSGYIGNDRIDDDAWQPIHPPGPADEGMLVLADPPMIAHLANARRDFGLRRDDGRGIPAGPPVLTGIEAETSGIGGRPGHFPVAGRALCLGGV